MTTQEVSAMPDFDNKLGFDVRSKKIKNYYQCQLDLLEMNTKITFCLSLKMAALLPEDIFNYVLTVEEFVLYVYVCEGKMPENCEKARKSVKEPPGKVCETMQMISFIIHAF